MSYPRLFLDFLSMSLTPASPPELKLQCSSLEEAKSSVPQPVGLPLPIDNPTGTPSDGELKPFRLPNPNYARGLPINPYLMLSVKITRFSLSINFPSSLKAS